MTLRTKTTHTDVYTFNKDNYTKARNYSPRQTVSSKKSKATASSAKRGTVGTYKVRKGDTLDKIARRNGTTVAKLRRLNGIENDKLSIGQKIKLK